tara:strand:- start:293 stop:541 length:249 start_codon:yes stop_codon:yes gene_type:complete
MIKTKEEIFLAEMGIHTQTIVEGDYTAKYKLKDLLKKYAEQCNIANVSNFVLLAKPNYKAKDGTIKRGIEIDGKYYAPQNDC